MAFNFSPKPQQQQRRPAVNPMGLGITATPFGETGFRSGGQQPPGAPQPVADQGQWWQGTGAAPTIGPGGPPNPAAGNTQAPSGLGQQIGPTSYLNQNGGVAMVDPAPGSSFEQAAQNFGGTTGAGGLNVQAPGLNWSQPQQAGGLPGTTGAGGLNIQAPGMNWSGAQTANPLGLGITATPGGDTGRDPFEPAAPAQQPGQPGMFGQAWQRLVSGQSPAVPTGQPVVPQQGDPTPFTPEVDPNQIPSHLGNEHGPLGVGPGVGNRIQQMGGGLLHSGNPEQGRLLRARAGGAPLTGNAGGDPSDLTGRGNIFLAGGGAARRAGWGAGATTSSDILRSILAGGGGSPLNSAPSFSGGATGFTPVIPGTLPEGVAKPGVGANGQPAPHTGGTPFATGVLGATPGMTSPNNPALPPGTGGGFGFPGYPPSHGPNNPHLPPSQPFEPGINNPMIGGGPTDPPFTIPFGNDMIGPGHPIWERLMGGSAGNSADGTNSGGEMIPWQEATPRDVLPGGDTTVFGTTATGHRIGSIDPRISAGITPFEPSTNTFAFGNPSGYGAIGPQSEEQMRAQAEQQAARLEAIRNQQQQPWHTAYGVGPQQRPEFWNAQGGYIGPDLNAVQGWMNESDPYGVDEYGNSLNAYGETGLNQPAPGNNLYPVPAGGNQQSGGGGGGGLGGLGGLLGGAGGDGASAIGNIFGGNLNVPIEPILTSQQIQALINNAIGGNIATEQGAVNRARESFAGRGLSGGSPGMQSVENRLGLNRAIADTQARTQIPIEAARLNAGYTTDALEGLSRQRSLDIGAWSAAQNAQTGAISPFLSALVALMG